MSAVTDQAEGLRRMLGRHLPRVVSFVAARAGTGRTTLAVQLAQALQREGRRVLLVDGNRRLGNAADLLEVRPRHELAHVLAGERALEDVVLRSRHGLALLPAARGLELLEAGAPGVPAPLARLFASVDAVLVDAALGECGALRLPMRARHDAVVTTSAHPEAITRTYAWIKRSQPVLAGARLCLAVCRAPSAHEARAVHANLAGVAGRYLGVRLEELPLEPGLRAAATRLFDDDAPPPAPGPWRARATGLAHDVRP